jgi:multidrug efflux pump subunit AcrA (membrane-fusion protein)
MVHRDAVIQSHGNFVVWVVREGKALPVPVKVAAYAGMEAAVRGQGLKAGVDVVIKGNERLRPGQPVMATN